MFFGFLGTCFNSSCCLLQPIINPSKLQFLIKMEVFGWLHILIFGLSCFQFSEDSNYNGNTWLMICLVYALSYTYEANHSCLAMCVCVLCVCCVCMCARVCAYMCVCVVCVLCVCAHVCVHACVCVWARVHNISNIMNSWCGL